MTASRRLPRMRLRTTIPVAVVLLTVTLAASLLFSSYSESSHELRAFARVLLEPVATSIVADARRLLDRVGGAAQVGAEVASTTGAATRTDELEALELSLLVAHPDFFYVQYGDERGNFLMVERQPDGALNTKRMQREGGALISSRWTLRAPGGGLGDVRGHRDDPKPYDPRERPWYAGARGAAGVYWTRVYVHDTNHEPVITAARALANGGVISATVSLEGLSSYLRSVRIAGRALHVFLIDEDAQMIAWSGDPSVVNKTALVPLASLQVPEIAAIAGLGVIPTAARPGGVDFDYVVGGHRYLGLLRPLELGPGRRWLVGAVVPEDAYLGGLKAGVLRSAGAGALILAVFVVLGLLLGNEVSRALALIADRTRRIRHLELETRDLPDSRFEEIAEINEVYGSMKTALRAFQRYVPIKLVRLLLSEGVEPELGGEIEELTVFFSDVRGFSALAEKLPPDELADKLGGYLGVIADILGERQGTVDKFIGDAVMAFWNAPRPVADHAAEAVRAAIACRDAIAALPGGDELFTRMGIHTGPVMVGHFGSPERLSYTALGDGVNLAARLEGVNKEYGTQILVSQATYDRVAHRFAFRRIDRVAVKGKVESTVVYEVLGELSAVAAPVKAAARTYEAALEAYFAGDFERAAALFEAAIEARPRDKAAEVMLARSRGFLDDPPPPDWDGVFVLVTK